MPFDFSRLLQSIAQRARWLHGLSVASIVLAAASIAALAAMIVVRALHIPVPFWTPITLVFLPALLGFAAYLFGRSAQPRLPDLLLLVDDRLGLKARFSSLYELRQRGGTSIFYCRIEDDVRNAVDWQRALPLGRRTILGGSTSACCIAAALSLALLPLPVRIATPSDPIGYASATAPEREFDTARSLEPSAREAAGLPAAQPTIELDRSAGTQIPGTPNTDHSLEDVMRDLSGMPTDESVIAPLSRDEIERLAAKQREARRALGELLDSIQDRLSGAPPGQQPYLTDHEREALQRELDREGLAPEMQQGINELLNPPQSRTVEEIVEQLVDQLADGEESEGSDADGEGPAAPQTTAVAPSTQDIEELLEALGQSSSEEDGTDTIELPAGAGEPGDASQSPDSELSQMDRPGLAGPGEEENSDQTGGTDGVGGMPGLEEQQDPGFIREQEQANVATHGHFVDEFITEGVPIESTSADDSDRLSLQVSYDRMLSILRERGLPDGAIDIVRDYFNAITEGGT